MGDILLAVMMLLLFVLGYFAVDRFGQFIDECFRGDRGPEEPDRKVLIAETEGRSAAEISEEVNAMLDSIQKGKASEIIICKTIDPEIIEYVKTRGCAVKSSIRQ